MANMRKKSRPERTDVEFIKKMKDLAKFRYMKNLEKKEPSFSEMTRLLPRTQGWQISIRELMTKPRKEDLQRR